MNTYNPYIPGGRVTKRTVCNCVTAKVGGSTPLRPVPNIITGTDLDNYVALMDPLITSLWDDAKAQFVYVSPAVLRSQAASLTSDMFADVREQLLSEAKKLDARIAKKTEAQVINEENWGSSYKAFMRRWEAEKPASGKILTTGGDWTRLQGFDLEFQDHRSKFIELGGKPSRALPTPPVTPSIPWKSILVVTGIVGAAVLFAQVRSFIPRMAP